jgi:hypothetical protein
MIRNRAIVNFAYRAFFGPDAAREIAEVVDGERDISGASLANRFAVVQRFGERQKFQVLFHLVGDLQQNR